MPALTKLQGVGFRGIQFTSPLTIVTPSRWLADCARSSALFKGCRVEVIHNCIETDIYTPVAKSAAKAELGIDPE